LSCLCAMPSLTAETLAALEEKLQIAFKAFDEDGSGAVDTKEITKMMLSLGLLVQPEVVAKMIKEADTDSSGQIEWEEFKAVMVKQAEANSSTGPFAALVNRKNDGPMPPKWNPAKSGPGFEIDGLQVTKKGGGWGVQAFDTSLSSSGTDSCDVLIEFTEIPGECYIGLIGNNFTKEFNVDPKTSGHAIVCHYAGIDTPGQFYHKAQDTGSVIRLGPLKKGDAIQLEVRMKDKTVRFSQLDEVDIEAAKMPTVKSSQIVDDLMSEMFVAIACGPAPEGKPFVFKLLGASCEKTLADDSKPNETESHEKQMASSNPAAAAAMTLA
jgi:hypothetical protein